MADKQSLNHSFARISGKRVRRRMPPPTREDKKGIPLVKSVNDPTLDWQPISASLQVRLDNNSGIIMFRNMREEILMTCTRNCLENTLRLIPKKIR